MATRDPGSGTGTDPSKSATGSTAGGAASGARSSPDGSGSTEPAGTRIRDETRRLTEQAKERARSFATERKQMAADQVSSVARALQSAADSLRDQNQGAVAEYIGRAADGLDRFSGALRERDLGALARQAQDMARQQPALLIGGAMVAGFLAARFAKASGARQDGRQFAEGTSGTGTVGGAGWSAGESPEGGSY